MSCIKCPVVTFFFFFFFACFFFFFMGGRGGCERASTGKEFRVFKKCQSNWNTKRLRLLK